MTPRRPTARAGRTSSTPQISSSGLALDGKVEPLLSGAVHYWRLDRAHWKKALEGLLELGLRGVETYVPWGVHELPDGSTDFGEADARRDLSAFLSLVKEMGMWAFVRPGPHINAELTFFGLPRRIVRDPDCMARSATGKPVPFVAPPKMFAVPSYASRAFREKTGRWYEALARVLRPHVWPAGPVVLLQADNEAAFYFRDGPYDQDYHPDAIDAFRSFLKVRHGGLDTLCERHRQDYADWDQVEAPTRMDAAEAADLPLHLDWMAFQEWLIGDALRDMGARLKHSLGAELPVIHNLPMGDKGLATSLGSFSKCVDLVGLDYYHTRDGFETIRDRTLRLAGSTHHAYAPELGAGAPPWFGRRDAQGDLFTVLCAAAYGLRGFNMYMAVGRDRWFGSPLGEDGRRRPGAEPWQRLIEALKAAQFHALKRRVAVALQLPREYACLTRATHRLGALSPTLLDLVGHPPGTGSSRQDFGFEQPIQIAWARALRLVSAALERAGVPYVFVDSDAPLPEGLRVLVSPTYEFAEISRWQGLATFVEEGGKLIYGPHLPRMDAHLREHGFAFPGNVEPTVLRGEAEAAALAERLKESLGIELDACVEPWPLRSTVHGQDGRPRVLFIINPERTPQSAEVSLSRPCRLTDPLAQETFEANPGCLVPMPGRHCRLLLIEEGQPA